MRNSVLILLTGLLLTSGILAQNNLGDYINQVCVTLKRKTAYKKTERHMRDSQHFAKLKELQIHVQADIICCKL